MTRERSPITCRRADHPPVQSAVAVSRQMMTAVRVCLSGVAKCLRGEEPSGGLHCQPRGNSRQSSRNGTGFWLNKAPAGFVQTVEESFASKAPDDAGSSTGPASAL